MKNKEIEELLNMLKKCAREDKATLKLNEIACKTILSYIEQLENKVDQYENPDDLTLFYMWINEKAKDKMKQLENNRDKALKIIDNYELGKYDYSIPSGGIIELREALKGDNK